MYSFMFECVVVSHVRITIVCFKVKGIKLAQKTITGLMILHWENAKRTESAIKP